MNVEHRIMYSVSFLKMTEQADTAEAATKAGSESML
jgi:hypothetical protein